MDIGMLEHRFALDEQRLAEQSQIIIDQNLHCSILVVGAGGAGLAAALEASAYSDSVVLIEKESLALYPRLRAIRPGYFGRKRPK